MPRNESSSPILGPRYCPDCRQAEPDIFGRSLCPECGGSLIPQGYCPVCEDHWRLGVRALCPKQVPANRLADARIIPSQNWSLPSDESADFEDLV
jgi:hypothetical protein